MTLIYHVIARFLQSSFPLLPNDAEHELIYKGFETSGDQEFIKKKALDEKKRCYECKKKP
jgi:hypothetical protein